jgi:hypothetical protein
MVGLLCRRMGYGSFSLYYVLLSGGWVFVMLCCFNLFGWGLCGHCALFLHIACVHWARISMAPCFNYDGLSVAWFWWCGLTYHLVGFVWLVGFVLCHSVVPVSYMVIFLDFSLSFTILTCLWFLAVIFIMCWFYGLHRGICTYGLCLSLPRLSTVGKPRLVVVAVQGAPLEKRLLLML